MVCTWRKDSSLVRRADKVVISSNTNSHLCGSLSVQPGAVSGLTIYFLGLHKRGLALSWNYSPWVGTHSL